MSSNTINTKLKRKGILSEILIQIAIAIIFFFGTSFGRGDDNIQWHRLIFIGNYLIIALVINYWLLPKFYYKRQFVQFAIGFALAIVCGMLMEEFVLERILFPETRGARFMGSVFMMVRMLPFIMLFVGFKFAWDAQSRQSEVEALKRLVSESQLQFLKSQVNPHFLFNSLNNLYSYALEKSPKTPQIILDLSSLLRYMLYDCRSEQVPLKDEVKYLADFVKLQNLQIEDRGKVTFDSRGNFDNKFIAPLILIVFIENCFKHSTASQSSKIIIDIDVVLDGDELNMICRNTYSKQGNLESLTKGIGLENVKQRLSLLYPNKHQLRIDTRDDWYIVDLKIDVTQ